MIPINVDVYERVRESDGRYIVAPGHEAGEHVIEEHTPDFSIVEASA